VDKYEKLMLHKFEMLMRRERQLSRVPDTDSRIRFYSKNSHPGYRKN
jgi:hypothetical protein